ncbi:hypothetical protein G7K71_08500 [Desulfofundulus sp. TPOSR]|uniref:hypothetical protein n=1 Tax=Desulfofundulus sp. TPOSR TaxID=2714340 RepID=UPI0014091B05|nr:hypothetical protein [Desulfofundulus sp. TPOSR]NHM25434.1 hypothetical protein [Desulfofundulus sp. TPOSR]NHM27023.1 hypothetical protein [Desulfofundulus sp. TPOSR]
MLNKKSVVDRFTRPICRVDIRTGEGFCRLKEFWMSGGYREITPEEFERMEGQAGATSPPRPATIPQDVEAADSLLTAEEIRRIEMMACDGWTIKDKLRVRAWLAAGMDCRQAARLLGRDARSVAGLSRQLGTLEEHIRVLVLAARGMNDAEIARELGMKLKRVAGIRLKYMPAKEACTNSGGSRCRRWQ